MRRRHRHVHQPPGCLSAGCLTNLATTCVGGPPPNCDDGNPCTADSCNPDVGCVHTPTPGVSCDDGNACTTHDNCNATGMCTGGIVLNCDDGNSCTTDTCNSQFGCVHQPLPLGSACNDGNACTTGDTCVAATATSTCLRGDCAVDVICQGSTRNCDDSNVCTTDTCDPTTGCVNTPRPEASCDDHNACTIYDICDDRGTCVGHVMNTCDDGDQCTADSCNPTTGCAHTPRYGLPCDDGNACTTNDVCSGPVPPFVSNPVLTCIGGPPPNCDDGNPCTADSCNTATGCVHTATPGVACNDGNACTSNDTCTSTGACVGRDVTPPVISNLTANPAYLWPPNHTMRNITLSYTASDGCGGAVTCQVTQVTSNEPVNGTGDGDASPDWSSLPTTSLQLRAERAGGGAGRVYTITLTCADGSGNATTATTTVQVKHDISSPKSGAAFRIGSTVSFAGSFWDVLGKTHTGQWLFDSLSTPAVISEPTASRPGSVTGAYTFTSAGVYAVKMNVTDRSGATGSADAVDGVDDLVVVYDPSGGFVTGGGWLNSPAGALTSNPALTGKVNFGFVSKYFRNATNPRGETEFDFRLAGFTFNAVNFDYLVVSGPKAQYKGAGKVNGGGSYQFILTVIDGQYSGTGVDTFRIKIWNKSSGAIVYDNQRGAPDNADPTTPVGAGSSIVIQP
jgi:hypothetical protein